MNFQRCPLRLCMYFPSGANGKEAMVEDLLGAVGLGQLLQEWTLDVSANWHQILGKGESQMLAFARLLYHRPRLALMEGMG